MKPYALGEAVCARWTRSYRVESHETSGIAKAAEKPYTAGESDVYLLLIEDVVYRIVVLGLLQTERDRHVPRGCDVVVVEIVTPDSLEADA